MYMDMFDSLLKMLSSLGVVVALMVLVAAAARRWLKPALAGSVPFIDLRLARSLPIGGRRSVMVLEVAGRTLVVGATPQQLVLLTQFDSDGVRLDSSADSSQPAAKLNRKIDSAPIQEPGEGTTVPVQVRVSEAIRNHRMGTMMRSRS
jgi:flagellar biogenesis protein FliO